VRLTPRQAYLVEASVKGYRHRLLALIARDHGSPTLQNHNTRKIIELEELLRALSNRPTRHHIEENEA
jgi:hypothetical protein